MMSVSRLEVQHVAVESSNYPGSEVVASLRSRIPRVSVSHYDVTVDAHVDLSDIVNTVVSYWQYLSSSHWSGVVDSNSWHSWGRTLSFYLISFNDLIL